MDTLSITHAAYRLRFYGYGLKARCRPETSNNQLCDVHLGPGAILCKDVKPGSRLPGSQLSSLA